MSSVVFRALNAGGFTSPEELSAAAHSSGFAMALSNEVAQAGGTPQALDVQADVSLGPDPAGGFKLTGIKLTVRGEVDGINAEQFAAAAQAAKAVNQAELDLITAGIRGELALSLSPFVLTETERNIRQHAPRALSAFQLLVPVLTPYLVNPTIASVRRVARLVHPKDAPIVAGAMRAHPEWTSGTRREERRLMDAVDPELVDGIERGGPASAAVFQPELGQLLQIGLGA